METMSLISNMQDNWQAWGIGIAVTVLVGAVLRMAKKNEWAQKLQKFGIANGKAFSFLLMRWIPAQAAEKAEEGIIVTLISLVKSYLDGFEIGILSDNIKRNEGKK